MPPTPTPEAPEPEAAPPPSSEAPPETPPEPAASPVGAVPLDADDTRGRHFRALMGHTATLVLGGILVLGAGIGLAAAVGPAIGGAAAVGALLLVMLVVFLIASGRAEADFFRAYAEGRGLAWHKGRTQLPPATPLLRKGDNRYADHTLRGALPGGRDGTLALYTYEEETRDSDGDKSTTYFHFTVSLMDLPEFAPFVSELYCQRRVGFRFMDGMEDVFRKRQRVEQESAEVDRRYEIFCGEKDDMNRVRQILSPTFLVWLADHSPEAFAFECVAGALVCNVKGHKKEAGVLDSFCEAASSVAQRLHDEAHE
jgi:hypothetical protein